MSSLESEDFRVAKLERLRALGVEPYGERFPGAQRIAEVRAAFQPEGKVKVRTAGRIKTLRAMGKASFADVKDCSGSIQVYFKLDKLGEQLFEIYRQLEPGDLVGVEGELFKTRSGELTVFVEDFPGPPGRIPPIRRFKWCPKATSGPWATG